VSRSECPRAEGVRRSSRPDYLRKYLIVNGACGFGTALFPPELPEGRLVQPFPLVLGFPWTTFDGVRSDAELAVLLRNRRAKFFVPLAAFGQDREAVLAPKSRCRRFVHSRGFERVAQ
jgi:hypothetical protein